MVMGGYRQVRKTQAMLSALVFACACWAAPAIALADDMPFSFLDSSSGAPDIDVKISAGDQQIAEKVLRALRRNDAHFSSFFMQLKVASRTYRLKARPQPQGKMSDADAIAFIDNLLEGNINRKRQSRLSLEKDYSFTERWENWELYYRTPDL